jgi:AcrR family transcriptional regulator
MALPRGRKSTQRERLLAGIVATVDRGGYANANVSRIIAAAGVSRPTFYEYFSDRDDCFLGALSDIHERLTTHIRDAIGAAAPELALEASIAAIVEFASAEPAQALFLTSQAMGAGRGALDARDAGIVAIQREIEQAQAQSPPTALVPDVSPRIVIGGVYRLLAVRLRRGEPGLGRASEDLSRWVASYRRPAGELRWPSFEPTRTGPSLAPGSPRPAPGAPTKDLVANRRERILYAAAQLAESKGYNATTIADITRLAGVDGRAFYDAFADKQDAFMAVHEIGVQQVMRATAEAFFTEASWPERMWAAGLAFAGFLESNPMIAHIGFVEAYAVGPGAVQRVEDSHVTFTIFLQEGYQQQPARTPPSRLALEAIITCIFEIVYREARARSKPRVSGMLAPMALLALAPFMGAEEADRFIDHQLQAQLAAAQARHRLRGRTG